MRLTIRLATILITLVVCLGLVVHFSNSNNIQTVEELTSPAGVTQELLRYEPTIENALTKFATLVPVVKLLDTEPYGEENQRSIFTFSVESVLHGDQEVDNIRVLGETDFFAFDETYILLLHCHSSTAWPFDVYIPFVDFIFRVSGDRIDCLQDAKTRKFVAPFKDDKYNNLENFSQYVKATAKDPHPTVHAKDSVSVKELIRSDNIVIEIQPTKITQVTQVNPFVYITDFNILQNYRGSYQGTRVLLPQKLDVNNKYVVFLEEGDDVDDCFRLVSRNSIFSEQTQEYNMVKNVLESR